MSCAGASACVGGGAGGGRGGRSGRGSVFAGYAALVAGMLFFAAPLAAQQAPLRGLGEDIERAIAVWEVPGLAISIVKDDSVVYAEGFGVREIGRPEPVDERTIFAIGSSSKAFTAAAVGMLVDSGKVEWNAPATRYLPGFRLYDVYATRELTVRDLLSHRSGLARGDLMWYATDYDRDEILRRVRHLEPTWSFRAHFGYQNIMYLAAGEVVERVSGTNWDEFIDDRIFTPLGMRESSTTVLALDAQSNVATPHAEIDDVLRTVDWHNIDNIAPAGSINSNVLEMAQWVRLHLGDGTYEGREILSEDVVREMQAPNTIIRLEGFWDVIATGSHFMSYGLGWFLRDYEGEKVVMHGGNIDGMSALVAMVPERELGIVILTNRNGTALPYGIAQDVIDRHLDVPATDWSARLKATVDSLEAAGEAEDEEDVRVAGTSPSLPLDRYAGTYRSEMYGDLHVELVGGGLHARYGTVFDAPLEHWHFDTFQADWTDSMAGESFITFTLDAEGEVDEAAVRGLAEFERVEEEPDREPGQ